MGKGVLEEVDFVDNDASVMAFPDSDMMISIQFAFCFLNFDYECLRSVCCLNL